MKQNQQNKVSCLRKAPLRTQYKDDLDRVRKILLKADRILIGAGSGLSTAAGLSYSGPRFQKFFSAFIKRYGIRNMYSAGFIPFLHSRTNGHTGHNIAG